MISNKDNESACILADQFKNELQTTVQGTKSGRDWWKGSDCMKTLVGDRILSDLQHWGCSLSGQDRSPALWTSHQIFHYYRPGNRRMMYFVIMLLFFLTHFLQCFFLASRKSVYVQLTCTHFFFSSGSLPCLSFCLQLISYLYIMYLILMYIFIPLNWNSEVPLACDIYKLFKIPVINFNLILKNILI